MKKGELKKEEPKPQPAKLEEELVNVVSVDLKIEPITGLDVTKVAVSLIVRLHF